jgi:hypothetical protein
LLSRCSTTWATPPALTLVLIEKTNTRIILSSCQEYKHVCYVPISLFGLYHMGHAFFFLNIYQAYTLSHSTSPFLWWVFWDRVSWTICLGWLWTMNLLISASWVAKITDVSHWHLWVEVEVGNALTLLFMVF